MATEKRSAPGRAVLGSAVDQIVRQAEASVMLLRPGRQSV